MVMEAAPAAALVMPEPKFLLRFLIIAFDAPSELGEFDQALKADVLRQGRQPVFGGLLLPLRPLDQKPFWQARFAQPIIAMGVSSSTMRQRPANALAEAGSLAIMRPRLTSAAGAPSCRPRPQR